MFEKDFRKILIFTCVFGLLGILTIMYFFEASEVSVSYFLSTKREESVYVVSGVLKETNIKSNTLFFSLCDNFNCISCVYFNPTSTLLEKVENAKQRNQEIKVKAHFEYYYNLPELIIYKFYFKNKGDFS